MKINPINIIIIFLLTSCSSFSWKDFFSGGQNSEKRNEELLDDFEVENELKKRFAVRKKLDNDVQNPSPESGIEPKKPIVEKPTVKEVTAAPRKTIRPKPPVKKLETKQLAEVPHKMVSLYPEDYPERLKEFDKATKSFWGSFNSVQKTGEEIELNITYMGINTGKITLSSKPRSVIGSEVVYHLNARIKTSNYYSYLYEVDDFCDSFVRTKDFVPLKFSLIQRESGQNIDDLQLFDLQKLEAISLYKREANEKIKKNKKVAEIPMRFQDPLSIMFFIRGLPLDEKARYSIPVVNRGKVEEFILETGEKEEIKTKIGTFEAYKLRVENKHNGKTIKGGDMIFWYSADERRIFLKFEAEIKIGSVKGEIEKYTP